MAVHNEYLKGVRVRPARRQVEKLERRSRRKGQTLLRAGLMLLAMSAAGSLDTRAADEMPWPSPVPGWKAPVAGEHPRLVFRKTDIPRIRERAKTPEGQVMVRRLKELLGGAEAAPTDPKNYTLAHPAGYGMLYQLTGEKKYAELGKKCTQLALDGWSDRDGRYSFRSPNGNLRAGPSLALIAIGYDLCYDGWDDAFRQQTTKEIAEYQPKSGNATGTASIDGLAKGVRHGPHSNHWGCQIGGAALALLAVKNDPGVDGARVEELLKVAGENFIKQMTAGFGDGGYFNEAQPAGYIGSDTAFTMALRAFQVAGGQDFISPRRNASMITLRIVFELLRSPEDAQKALGNRGYHYPLWNYGGGNGYGTSYFERGENPPKGISNAGQFAQGFGAIDPRCRPALLWTYNHVVQPDPAKRVYDTVSPYPHRAVLALVNWPLAPEKEEDPAKILPERALHDSLHHYFVFRNRWQDSNDIAVVITWGGRDGPWPTCVWGLGELATWGAKAGGKAPTSSLLDVRPDGSGIAFGGNRCMAVDFSRQSGADALVVWIGAGAGGNITPSERRVKLSNKVKAGSVKGGSTEFHYLTLTSGGEHPPAKVEGDRLIVGQQSVTVKDGKLALSK